MHKVLQGIQNGKSVLVFRHLKSKSDNPNLGGEHFSVTVEEDSDKILGFTWFDQRFHKGQLLPTAAETQAVAIDLMRRMEPTLPDDIEHMWTQAHDESLIIGGKTVTITGMKYKCYVPSKENYTWVIVGSDGSVLTFEQGIIWQNGRVTEKWLHDMWLQDKKEIL